jgi:hypothetical protein
MMFELAAVHVKRVCLSCLGTFTFRNFPFVFLTPAGEEISRPLFLFFFLVISLVLFLFLLSAWDELALNFF